MCVRGLLMLMLNDSFADYMGSEISVKVLEVFEKVMTDSINENSSKKIDLDGQVPALAYLSVMPTKQMHEYVMTL